MFDIHLGENRFTECIGCEGFRRDLFQSHGPQGFHRTRGDPACPREHDLNGCKMHFTIIRQDSIEGRQLIQAGKIVEAMASLPRSIYRYVLRRDQRNVQRQ